MPIHAGAGNETAAVLDAWSCGQEVLGWALYWSSIHRFIVRMLSENASLRAATRVVRYDALCGEPAATLDLVARHGGYDGGNDAVRNFAAGIRYPSYYRPDFSGPEMDIIARHTKEVWNEVCDAAQEGA